ncbi:hypothetical protein H0H92_000746 [Tricholoma furcatifolium]|nr:hypothetical protein H0H92_000746 [Tricholoma furcatifolium]
MDATRTDGTFLAIKKADITYYSTMNELAVGKMFSSPELLEDPRNHCSPVLDFLQPEEGSDYGFIILPLLYRYNISPFETVGEGVDFILQILEGLHFMHSRNVLHGDVKSTNIMDLSPLYNHPPHPANSWYRRDFKGRSSKPASRTTRPVKYYLIDYDLSKIYESEEVRLMVPPWGGTRPVPEHLGPDAPPCDPYPVDIYCLGNVIKQRFMDGLEEARISPTIGFEFMRELVSDMMNNDPDKRPTMDEVMPRLQTIIEGLDEWTLRSPVMTVGKEYGIFGLIGHWAKQFTYMLRGIPAIPSYSSTSSEGS